MSKFIEVLHTGLTVRSKVCLAGERLEVPDTFPLASKQEQVTRWGKPRYREITRADFEAAGGAVKGEVAAAPSAAQIAEPKKAAAKKPAAEKVKTDERTEDSAEKFATFAGLGIEETLERAAQLNEQELLEFIAFEKAGAGRSEVLSALGAE